MVEKQHILNLLQQQRLHEANALCVAHCASNPSDPDAWFLLAGIHAQSGNLSEVVGCCSHVIDLQPDHSEAHFNLGVAHQALRQFEEAVQCYRRVLQYQCDHVRAQLNLGVVLWELKQFEESAKVYQQLLIQDPASAQAHANFGLVRWEQGRFEEAADSCQKALQLDSSQFQSHNSLGLALKGMGRFDEAIESFQEALRLNPEIVEARYNLGLCCSMQGRIDQATECFLRVLKQNPGHVGAYNDLGNIFNQQGLLEKATIHFNKAFQLDPKSSSVCNNLGTAMQNQGDLKQAISFYRQAMELESSNFAAHTNLLFAMNYTSAHDRDSIFAEHQRWAQQHADLQIAQRQPHPNTPDAGRRLRIGYVSPDFRSHSVAFFIEPVFAAHDRASVEVFAYANVVRPDAVTARLRGLVDHWREIHALNDEQVADLIRTDGIDILVDLAGHTGHHRLLVFARKPAPVQVTYLGYPNTTGMAAIDYRLTDAWADPPGESDAFHAEKLIRLPDGFLCYAPAEEAPPVGPLPALSGGSITFGCFNNCTKTTPEVIAVWCEILDAVPGARLLLKSKPFTDPAVQQRYRTAFARQGLDPQRLSLMGLVPGNGPHLDLYNRVDIGLDPFPYNGTTTTCEALWMGVPVIALAGDAHASRVGVSLLSSVGLVDCIAQSPQDYLERAVQLAADMPRLQALRASLRPRVQDSPLIDARRFTRNLEQAYRQMWQQWCDDVAS